MTAIPSSFRLLERITRRAPLGIIFWDVATGTPVRDGLSVAIAPVDRLDSTRQLFVNRQAVWLASSLPGTSIAAVDTDDWAALRRPFRITVSDPLGRFLPMHFDAELPSGGLYDWPGWPRLPAGPLAPLRVIQPTPRVSPDRIPLFSAPGRTPPPERAEVRCQLADLGTGKPASWAVLTAQYAGVVRAIGVADRRGQVVLHFSYPERPTPTLATTAITDYRWKLSLRAYSDHALGAAEDIPSVAAIMAQLNKPRALLASTKTPIAQLPDEILILGRPLIVRTSKTPRGPTSSLFMAAA